MRQHIVIAIIIIGSALPIAKDPFSRLYLWNVGQGLWITLVQNTSCYHFDMGGERNPKDKVLRQCGDKKNILFLTHADMDHIKFINWGARFLPKFCLNELPPETLSAQKKRIINFLPLCKNNMLVKTNVQQMHSLTKAIAVHNSKIKHLSPNDLSRAYFVSLHNNELLVAGDATIKTEATWTLHNQNQLAHTQLLVLGHHGSNTSTGEMLLKKMPMIKMSFASARKKRYNHPHPAVLERLLKHSIPIIKTEVWGDIAIDL